MAELTMQRKKQIPRLKLKARIASKVLEKDLLGKAKMLMDDPELILPECAEDCGSCPFRRTKARIEKIQRYKDDAAMLAKFAKRGDKLGRAYAATIGLVHEDKAPYLATAKYPGGTITFVLRGKTNKEKLIGVQNFDSPKWRVMSVLDLVRKKGLHFYSYGDSFVCTGKTSRPPEEYVKSAAESIGASMLEGDNLLCPHNPSSANHLEFTWASSGRKILVCDQCAIRAKNTLSKLSEGMAVPRVLDELEVSIARPLEQVAGNGGCRGLLDMPIGKDLLEDYAAGKIGDKDLIQKHTEEVLSSLKEVERKAYVRGSRCFGDDLEAFANDLTDDDLERNAVKGLLSRVHNPVVLESNDSVNKLLSTYWSEQGKDALRAVVPENLVERFYKDDAEALKSPLGLIRQALREAEHEAVSSKLPKYSCLAQYGGFADEVARAYKTGGQARAIAVLDSEKSNDHRMRSMAHAFYLALGVTTKSWKFTDEEKEYGKHLQAHARKLLESGGSEEHHKAFTDFLREAGCSEELKRA